MARGRATTGILITAGAIVFALTQVFLSMRAVMDVGGSCASGGPYVNAVACPRHVAGTMIISIWGGLIFVGLYVWQAARHRVPSFVSLLWPALFLSLGWNFFDYGIRGGGVAGWIVPGAIFVLMGGVPLVWALPHLWRVYVLGQHDAPAPLHVAAAGTAVGALKTMAGFQKPSMTDELERLDDLHKSGALDDFEYAKAKDRVIRGQSA